MRRPERAYLLVFWDEDLPYSEEIQVRGQCYSLHGFEISKECEQVLNIERRISKLAMEYYKSFDMVREERFDAGYHLLRKAMDENHSYPQHSVLVRWDSYSRNVQKAAKEERRADRHWLQAMGILWEFIGYDMMVQSELRGLDNLNTR